MKTYQSLEVGRLYIFKGAEGLTTNLRVGGRYKFLGIQPAGFKHPHDSSPDQIILEFTDETSPSIFRISFPTSAAGIDFSNVLLTEDSPS